MKYQILCKKKTLIYALGLKRIKNGAEMHKKMGSKSVNFNNYKSFVNKREINDKKVGV